MGVGIAGFMFQVCVEQEHLALRQLFVWLASVSVRAQGAGCGTCLMPSQPQQMPTLGLCPGA